MDFWRMANYSNLTHLSNSDGKDSKDSRVTSGSDVTQLLKRWRKGSREAESELMERVQGELRRLAAGYMRHERAGRTLQPTAVVNEAYLRLLPQRGVSWENRAHFFGIAAKMMRRVLVDHARRNLTAKRGGYVERTPFNDALAIPADIQQEMIDVDRALERFAEVDPESARIMEMRYFAGMSVEEVAEATSLSTATIKRASIAARSWLHREIAGLQ